MCGALEDIRLHVLYKCGLARGVWELSSLPSVVPKACCSVVEWWGMCFEKMKHGDVEALLTLSCAIWEARCKVIMMERESCDL